MRKTYEAFSLVGSLALLLGAGCDPQVVDYETPEGMAGDTATGGATEQSGGGSPGRIEGTGGRDWSQPHESTGGGAIEATGGRDGSESTGGKKGSGGEAPSETGGQGGAAGEDDFPWPELPDERGVVVGFEPWDMTSSGCCSRVPGSEPSEYCLPGVESRLAQVIPSNNGVAVGTAFDLGTDNSPVVVAFDSAVPVRIGVMETELVPPEHIIDMSPVYWVGGEEDELPDHFMVLLQRPEYGISYNHPGEKEPGLYYSADGTQFEPVAQNGALMYSGYIEKPGFVVVGAGPDTIQCSLD